MCEASASWFFAAGTNVVPNVNADARNSAVFVKNNIESVGQLELFIRNADLLCRWARRLAKLFRPRTPSGEAGFGTFSEMSRIQNGHRTKTKHVGSRDVSIAPYPKVRNASWPNQKDQSIKVPSEAWRLRDLGGSVGTQGAGCLWDGPFASPACCRVRGWDGMFAARYLALPWR